LTSNYFQPKFRKRHSARRFKNEAIKKAYYLALQQAEKGLDWVIWFIDMLLEAQTYADKMIQFTIAKWHFFSVFEHKLNPRQN
jgi:Fic family protein